MNIKKISILLITLCCITPTLADNVYFQITAGPKAGEDITIWGMLHGRQDYPMNVYANDQGEVWCKGIGCVVLKSYAEIGYFPAYTKLWNTMATCPSKEKWQLYLEVNASGGSKTYELESPRIKQDKETQATNSPFAIIMNPI